MCVAHIIEITTKKKYADIGMVSSLNIDWFDEHTHIQLLVAWLHGGNADAYLWDNFDIVEQFIRQWTVDISTLFDQNFPRSGTLSRGVFSLYLSLFPSLSLSLCWFHAKPLHGFEGTRSRSRHFRIFQSNRCAALCLTKQLLFVFCLL